MNNQGIVHKFSPLDLLSKLEKSEASGCLQVLSNQVLWSIYFEKGKIIYASHTVDPWGRLEQHLRRIGCKDTQNFKETYNQVQSNLPVNQRQPIKSLDYLSICYWLNQQYLDNFQVTELIEELTKEVIELFSWLQEGSYRFFSQNFAIPKLARLSVNSLINYGQERLQMWRSLSSSIELYSPYQRPYYFSNHPNKQAILPELRKPLNNVMEERLLTLLRGFSFRQLSASLKQDELKLIKCLQPYILNGTILLREPQAPFDRLPKISKVNTEVVVQNVSTFIKADNTTNISISLNENDTKAVPQPGFNKYKVVCVDDSQSILNELSRFLDDKNFSVFTVDDSVKALMQILRIKPDIILLDVGMPNLDGYDLCRLLRNNSVFKTIPIIMVTGNTGIIDRAKAKIVGATAYLTKPFDQTELLKVMFKNLS